MIWDSVIWKKELHKELDNFNMFLADIETSKDECFDFTVEKFFFVSAFMIRKLSEGNKLSDELTSKDFSCIEYRRIKSNSIIDHLNWHHMERFYNLEKKDTSLIKLRDICNFLIHSFAFCVVTDDSRKLSGILVNSDRTKDKYLLHIQLDTFIELINDVINDKVVRGCYDRVTGKLKNSRVISRKIRESGLDF